MINILDTIDLSTIFNMLHLDLEEKSGYYLGSCPFHEDSKPSFAVYKNGIYKCFTGCDSGNINKLIYKLTGQSAYKFLGIKDIRSFYFSESLKNKDKLEPKRDSFRTNPINIKGNFLDPFENERVYNYLRKRKCSDEFIKIFDIKYCNYVEINTTPFIDRLVIPIVYNGKIIAYEGRYIETKPKEFPCIYNKGSNVNRILFNVDNLDRKQPLIVCEGFFHINQIFDYITENVTYTFGAMISDKQIKILNEFDNVIFFIDNDSTGFRQVSKLDDLMEKEFYVAIPPNGYKDVNDMNVDRIEKCLEEKVLSIDYILEKSKLFKKDENTDKGWFL